MRISDWSSDVCSSDLPAADRRAVDRRFDRERSEIADVEPGAEQQAVVDADVGDDAIGRMVVDVGRGGACYLEPPADLFDPAGAVVRRPPEIGRAPGRERVGKYG